MKLKNLLLSNVLSLAKAVIPNTIAGRLVARYWQRPDIAAIKPTDIAGHEVDLALHEGSLFSQNGEDGILRFIFSEIGFDTRRFVEFGFGVTENNSLRLMLKESFGGLFLDGSEWSVAVMNKALGACRIDNTRAVCEFLNLENLDTTIALHHPQREIDLLTIDVDGNDYWFWKGITCVAPRVVVIEYNASYGPDRALTVPYDAAFDRHEKHPSGLYHGASLTALEQLGKTKGFALIGCDANGVNAFFVRHDCMTDTLRGVSATPSYVENRNRLDRGISTAEQFEIISDLPYVEV